jgi:hypothetical protein
MIRTLRAAGRAALLVCLALATRAHSEPWRATRFLIGGYGVNQSAQEPGRLLLFADAGLDYVHDMDHHGDFPAERDLSVQLDVLRRTHPGFGLQAILHDAYPKNDPARFTANADSNLDWAAIRRRVAPESGANRASTLGWSLWDEPCDRASLARAVDLVRRFRANPATAGQLPFVNLLTAADPGEPWCLDNEFGRGDRLATWTNYADAYLRAFDTDPWPAPVLSFDCYPFFNDGAIRSSYFETLRLARDLTLAHSRPGWRIPLWVIVQLAPFKPHGRPMMKGPSFVQTRWQAWTAVAYGARGICYWTTGTAPDSTLDERFGPGIVDLDGQPTPLHAPLAQLNRELHALGPTLMKLDPVAVFHAGRGHQGGIDAELLSNPNRDYGMVVRVSQSPGGADGLIGYLKDPATGDDYLLVVNQDLAKAHTFTLDLDVPADSLERIDRITGQRVPVGRNVSRFAAPNLPPASAELYRVVSPLLEHLPNVESVGRRGSVYEFRTRGRVLRVDYATGARSWAPHATEPAAPELRITPFGVLRMGH